MAKLWGGRFNEDSAELMDRFNASLGFDRKLYNQDIDGSKAHAKMLAKQGILSNEDCASILEGLEKVRGEIDSGEFEFNIKDEDIHMAIEKRLTEIIGEAGKRLHTARSRNDQVAVDFRSYSLFSNKEIRRLLLELIGTVINIAKNHTETLMPGMTHLQHAQPINFGYHMMAYANMFRRDFQRLSDSFERNNISPLGCAALAGTPYDTDRFFTAKELGFKEPSLNCLDTVSDRDFALDLLYDISLLFMHISRLSEELILWSSYEFRFIKLPDKYSSGSSIMPQKKNPDVPELLRGKTGRAYGNLISLLTVMKALPLAYNKDTQEDKEGVFDSVENITISLEILNEFLKEMKINCNNMAEASKIGHLTATDLADYLVKKLGIPFREAHHITGRCVALGEEKGKDICELSVEELKTVDDRLDEGAKGVLDLRVSMNSRDSYGGTSTKQTKLQIEKLEKWLEGVR